MPLPDWKSVRRILAVRLDNIGDVVMLSPALRALRHNFPSAQISLLASPAGSQVTPLLPWIDDVFTWQAIWQDVSGKMALDPSRETALVRILTECSFDAVFIFTSFSQSPFPAAYVSYLAGIPIRAGHSKEFGGSLLTITGPAPADHGHQVDRNLALIELAGLPLAGRYLELVIPPHIQTDTEYLFRNEGLDPLEPYIVVAPGASCEARRYDPMRFSQVIQKLAEEVNYPLILVGSEKERKTLEPVLTTGKRIQNRIFSFIGETSVPELAAIISRARLVLTNNSASLHIADAFSTPSVCLYSGTEYLSQWKPRNSQSILLRQETDCSPCFLFQCPFKMECLDINPNEVVRACIDLLERTEFSSNQSLVPSHQVWHKQEFIEVG